MDPAARGLEACWVRHPTEWGGEENVVPPARDGQEARWTPQRGVLLMEARDTPDRACAVDDGRQETRQTGRVLLMRGQETRQTGRVLLMMGGRDTPDRAYAVDDGRQGYARQGVCC